MCVCVRVHSFETSGEIQIVVEPDVNDEVKRYSLSATYYDNEKVLTFPRLTIGWPKQEKKSGKRYPEYRRSKSIFWERLKQTLDSSTYEHLYDGVESSEELLSMWKSGLCVNMDCVWQVVKARETPLKN